MIVECLIVFCSADWHPILVQYSGYPAYKLKSVMVWRKRVFLLRGVALDRHPIYQEVDAHFLEEPSIDFRADDIGGAFTARMTAVIFSEEGEESFYFTEALDLIRAFHGD